MERIKSTSEASEDATISFDGSEYPADEVKRTCEGELIHEPSGVVIEEQLIDRGPEWRSFEGDEDKTTRVGSPISVEYHDKGLSTTISSGNTDANGNRLSQGRKKEVRRLRKWQRRCATKDSKERNIRTAFGEVQRMATALGLPESTREMASVLYRRAHEEGLLPGRSIEGIASAALYVGARQDGIPRTLDELANVSRVSRVEIRRGYKYIQRELSLKMPPQTPEEYLPRFASELNCEFEIEGFARELVGVAREHSDSSLSGKNPVSIAAAALYAAGHALDVDITQAELEEITDVSSWTIRERYPEILEAYGAETDSLNRRDDDAIRAIAD